MKRQISFALTVLGIIVLVCLAAARTAPAGVVFSDDKVSVSYECRWEDNDNKTYLNAYASTEIGLIYQATVSYNPQWMENENGIWVPSPDHGNANFFFYGPMVAPTKEKEYVGVQLAFNRDLIRVDEYVGCGVSSYGGRGKGSSDPMGDLYSYVQAGFFGNFTQDGGAYGSYDQNLNPNDNIWYWYFSVNIPIVWEKGVVVGELPSVSVPEPASLASLCLAGLPLIRRRRV